MKYDFDSNVTKCLRGHSHMTSEVFGILDPLPPCPQIVLIYSTKSKQPPLLHLLLDQPPPLDADVIMFNPAIREIIMPEEGVEPDQGRQAGPGHFTSRL